MERIAFGGISGKTGRTVAGNLSENNHIDIVAGIGENSVGTDIGELLHNKKNYKYIYKNFQEVIDNQEVDLFIDFSTCEAAPKNIELALINKISTIVGTTGIDEKEIERLSSIAKENNVFLLWSSNFSLGIASLSNALNALSKIFDKDNIGIIEVHHSDKADMPSGTALYLKDKIGLTSNQNISSLRIPLKISRHTIFASGVGENLFIEHTVVDSQAFTVGILFVINNYREFTGVYLDLASFLKVLEKKV
ncbi:4-hydroxy-tetrahydrodipicolinate reductase [Lysinibacillus sp. 54212]|uniref:4-hydroxy-tetrahydrodipicolinate reductase n=1 Tax=Lysinibacillus sp. 54212 TaxID=3119829 RepID=UPI002FC6F2CC